MSSPLEQQLEEYFVALDARLSPEEADVRHLDDRVQHRRPAKRALLLAVAAVVVLVFGLVAARIGGVDGTDEVATGPTALTFPPTVDGGCTTLYGSRPEVSLYDESATEPNCYLAAEDQILRIWNKGSEPTSIELRDGPVVLASDDYVDTPPLGEWPGRGEQLIASTPYAGLALDVVTAADSPTANVTFDLDSMGPFDLGDRIDDVATASNLALGLLAGFHFDDRCAPVTVIGDPYSPLLHLSNLPDGTRFLRSITVNSPTQLGPDGIAVGMTSAELQARTGSAWENVAHPLADTQLRTAMAWTRSEDRQIVAILDDDQVEQFIVRDPSSPAVPIPSVDVDPDALGCFHQ